MANPANRTQQAPPATQPDPEKQTDPQSAQPPTPADAASDSTQQAPPATQPNPPEHKQPSTARKAAVLLHITLNHGKDFKLLKLGATHAVITNGKITPKIALPVVLHDLKS